MKGSDMPCCKFKIFPKNSCGTNSIGSLPSKEEPNDLIITNHVALDKEHSQRPLTPVIRVWEGDFEVVEQNTAEKGTQLPLSYTAWEGDFEAETNESTASNPSLVEKATSMAHELVHLVTKNDSHENEGSDIELEDVVKSINPKYKKKVDKQTLLTSQNNEEDHKNEEDAKELLRLTSFEDRPSFENSHLVFDESPSPVIEDSEGNVTENVYVREDSTPVIIEHSEIDKVVDDGNRDNVLRNPSFDNKPITESEDVSRRTSVRSSTSSGSRRSKGTGSQDEEWEMKQLNVQQQHSPQSTTHEETGLLSSTEEPTVGTPLQDSYRMSQTSENVDDDVSSDGSEFLGSLGIYMPAGRWESDLRVELDVQLGRDEWNSTFLEIEGDATREGWDASLAEISKGGAQQGDWNSSLPEISDLISVKSEWSTMIPESLLKEDDPNDWNCRFNQIEKLSDDRAHWRSTLTKIRERLCDKNEWKFSMKKIGNKKKRTSDEWKFKLTNKFESQNDKNNDWNSKFNEPGSVTLAEDDWRLRAREIDVRSDDRSTHWGTKFLKIQEKNETEETWKTRFNKIEPIPEDKTWETTIVEPSDELGGPEDWNIKFIDIESNEDKPSEWEIEMKDVPNSKTDPADWNFKFKQLEEHLKNPKEAWDFKFNSILENLNDRESWENIFKQLDRGENNKWDIKFNQISNERDDLDWQLTINDIEVSE